MSNDSEIDKKKKEKDISFLIKSTTRAGKTYTYIPPSSATATFTNIADKFEKNPFDPRSKDNLTDYWLKEKDLELYVELGYLEKPSDNTYKLTERGLDALKWNREFKKKWKRE